MILLDENIRRDQAVQLLDWRIRRRFLIEDFAPAGIQDPDIIPLLQRLKHPAFFTHDRDFFRRNLLHHNYALAWLDVFDGDAAKLIRSFLKHPLFDTAAKRTGLVVRLHYHGIHFWHGKNSALQQARWIDRG